MAQMMTQVQSRILLKKQAIALHGNYIWDSCCSFPPQKKGSSTPTMKSFCILVFCLLVLTVNAIAPFMTEIASSLSATKENQIVGRHSARKLSSTMYKHQQKTQEIKVTGGGGESEAGGLGGGETEGSSDANGLIYNVDYHGVSTHPSPSPKHPMP